eukprot:GFUD01132484.1.p1 GENE.GFUD01132484.1~~GFUD01132484.1.p1  ORF type:complete len:183 (-),score=26.47 GFUD01132484.1:19-567(-)
MEAWLCLLSLILVAFSNYTTLSIAKKIRSSITENSKVNEKSKIEGLMRSKAKDSKKKATTIFETSATFWEPPKVIFSNGKISWKGKKINTLILGINPSNPISCLMIIQKKVKKRGKCHNTLCVVGNRFYHSKRCQRSSRRFCTAKLATKSAITGTCNMFGVCRTGQQAQLDHQACKDISWPG